VKTRSSIASSSARARRVNEPTRKILQHGQPVEQPSSLRHVGDAHFGDPVGGEPVDPGAAEQDLAPVGPKLAGDGADGRRLARAVRSDDRHDLALVHGEADVVERGHAVVRRGDMAHLEEH